MLETMIFILVLFLIHCEVTLTLRPHFPRKSVLMFIFNCMLVLGCQQRAIAAWQQENAMAMVIAEQFGLAAAPGAIAVCKPRSGSRILIPIGPNF